MPLLYWSISSCDLLGSWASPSLFRPEAGESTHQFI